MKMTLHHPKLLRIWAIGVASAAIALTGCKSTDRTMGQKINDMEVKRSVDHALAKDPTYKYNDVRANVMDGNVQLTGFVDTPVQRTRAAEIASHADGVKQVVNEIMIKTSPTGPANIRDAFGHNDAAVITNNTPSQYQNQPQYQENQNR